MKANPSPNDQLVGRLKNKFFKTFVHVDNNVITTEDLYKKNEQWKKKILIRTGPENGNNFRFRRNTDFYVSCKRYAQRFSNKILNFL